MATATQSKLSTKVKVVALAGAVIIAGMSPVGQRVIKTVGERLRYENQDRVVFSITFTPNYRETGVHVIAMVEGVEFHNDLHPRPFSFGTWIPKGAETSAHAQQITVGKLACTAQLNGVIVDSSYRNDIGSIRCWVNRRTPDVR